MLLYGLVACVCFLKALLVIYMQGNITSGKKVLSLIAIHAQTVSDAVSYSNDIPRLIAHSVVTPVTAHSS